MNIYDKITKMCECEKFTNDQILLMCIFRGSGFSEGISRSLVDYFRKNIDNKESQHMSSELIKYAKTHKFDYHNARLLYQATETMISGDLSNKDILQILNSPYSYRYGDIRSITNPFKAYSKLLNSNESLLSTPELIESFLMCNDYKIFAELIKYVGIDNLDVIKIAILVYWDILHKDDDINNKYFDIRQRMVHSDNLEDNYLLEFCNAYTYICKTNNIHPPMRYLRLFVDLPKTISMDGLEYIHHSYIERFMSFIYYLMLHEGHLSPIFDGIRLWDMKVRFKDNINPEISNKVSEVLKENIYTRYDHSKLLSELDAIYTGLSQEIILNYDENMSDMRTFIDNKCIDIEPSLVPYIYKKFVSRYEEDVYTSDMIDIFGREDIDKYKYIVRERKEDSKMNIERDIKELNDMKKQLIRSEEDINDGFFIDSERVSNIFSDICPEGFKTDNIDMKDIKEGLIDLHVGLMKKSINTLLDNLCYDKLPDDLRNEIDKLIIEFKTGNCEECDCDKNNTCECDCHVVTDSDKEIFDIFHENFLDRLKLRLKKKIGE